MKSAIKVGQASRLPRLDAAKHKANARADALVRQAGRLSYFGEIL